MADRRQRRAKKTNESLRFPRASYTSNRNEVSLSSKKSLEQSKQRKLMLKRGVITLLVFAALVFLFAWAASFSEVKVIVDQKTAVAEQQGAEEDYRQVFDSYLASSNFLTRNKFFIDRDAMEESFKAQFPQVERVDLDASLLSTSSSLKIYLRDPVAVYVGSNGEFLIDDTGIAFKDVTGESTDYPKITDDAPQPVVINESVVAPVIAAYVNDLERELTDVGLVASEYSIPLSVREVLIQLEGAPYVVKAYTDIGAEQIAVSLKETVDWLTQQGIVPTQYIDLRLPFEAAVK